MYKEYFALHRFFSHRPTRDVESDLETIMNKAKAEVNSASRAVAWSAYTALDLRGCALYQCALFLEHLQS
jgi:hypothetical protein